MKIPASKIEAFVATDDTATIAMKCVYFDRENERLVATDGHMAIRVDVIVEDDDVSGLVPVEVFELARKEFKSLKRLLGKDQMPDPWLKVTCGTDAVIIENLLSHTNHIVNREKLSDTIKYPAIDRVFPQAEGAPTVTLNRSLLTSILANIDGEDGVSFWVTSNERPVVMASADGKSCAILMPMRGDIDAREVMLRGYAEPVEVAEPEPEKQEA